VRKARAVKRRDGAAAVELALLAPFLAFLFVAAVDYGRVFYYSITLENCARNGALYASDPTNAAFSRYTSASDAALADASNLSPAPTVTSTSGTDSSGQAYVTVTVTWTFHTLTSYPGIPSSTTLSRSVRVNVAPAAPK
jgi:Flp pilus assembly protein TadG